ncbi:adhesion G protein-coupled receptor B2 [Trichonephila clavipes]|nr:adhesion G protein-coupled receptor B2 [Trichonephila clavipes]
MSFGKALKQDFHILSFRLRIEETDSLKVIELKKSIAESSNYEEDVGKEMLNTIIEKHPNNLVALHFKYDFWHRTATAGSDVVQSGRPIFDDFFQHLWPYIGNNTANAVFQMVKRLWFIRIDQ